ncbi:hypothetical protein EYY96_05350 [Hafnia alvei]|uniref:Uncharacterized protein n=1 Tax=Hafnia alvei TaxID=569 RepID=A0ABD7Q7H1_HAFAL|nr:hypothetical protein EYY96_05350 [Hafnia alvei]
MPKAIHKTRDKNHAHRLTAMLMLHEHICTLNRTGFFGEFLVRKLGQPDPYSRWKRNTLFRLLLAVCVLVVQVTFDC